MAPANDATGGAATSRDAGATMDASAIDPIAFCDSIFDGSTISGAGTPCSPPTLMSRDEAVVEADGIAAVATGRSGACRTGCRRALVCGGSLTARVDGAPTPWDDDARGPGREARLAADEALERCTLVVGLEGALESSARATDGKLARPANIS